MVQIEVKPDVDFTDDLADDLVYFAILIAKG